MAKKYLLNNLEATVSEYILSAYGSQGVAKVLPHLHHLEGDHAKLIRFGPADEPGQAVLRYNVAWADYYQSLGMHKQARMIEHQMRKQRQAAGGTRP
ncbi:hypothetical protein AAVH_13427 [Aphelenchoides avenae]|nr:hypothetical protein AAVH_13427 [Aphelenchus avenae]